MNTRIVRFLFGTIIASMIALLLLIWPTPVVHANTLTVTNTGDNGAGSLRNTIAGASANDTIVFSLTLPATIALASELDITKTLTISGTNSSQLTISGAGVTRVISVSAAVTLNLYGVTIANGNDGGTGGAGLYNAGGTANISTTVFYSNTTSNSGGAIFENSGTLTILNSKFVSNTATMNAGAIENFFGNMTITNTVIGDSPGANSALNGGGIFNIGVATLTSVTLSSNTVNWNGGGIFNGSADGANVGIMTLNNSTVSYNSSISGFHLGGGIANAAGAMTLTNTTISGNSVDSTFATGGYGGGIWNGAVMTLTHATLSGNSAWHGGGLYQDTSSPAKAITLTNTIIANGSKGENCYVNGTTPIGSKGYNLSSDGTCTTYLNQTGDLNNANPKLGTLANNGGSTLTHALLPDSPAIDQIPVGTNGCGTTITMDQRGAHRPIGKQCDIGAYEAPVNLFLPLILR